MNVLVELTARAMMPVMIPIFTAIIMYGGVKSSFLMESGFRPFLR